MTTFVIAVELGANSFPFRKAGYSGGFVNCVVVANDIRTALDLAEAALTEDGYEIEQIEKALLFESEEWEHAPEIFRLVKEATPMSAVQYSEFVVYGS